MNGVDLVVSLIGFSALLWWVPKSELRLMPVIFGLVVYFPYLTVEPAIEIAWVAYVAILFFATLQMAIDLAGVYSWK